jgi:biotin carboxyl carrier protein
MIAQPRPHFRNDLVAQPIDEEGERFVDVTDPDSGKTFRFYEVEYSIACAMNGQRDVSGLAIWAQMELGLQTSPDELQTVINTLADLGYLADWSKGGEQPGTADEATFVGPGLSPGAAGSARVATAQPPELKPAGGEQSFAGLMDDDEDHVPTQIKRPGQITGTETAVPSLQPVGSTPDADDDGPTNLPAPSTDFEDEMSVDLSDHLHLGPDAVKEAVRQSRLMQADADASSKGASTGSTAKPVELSDKRAQVSKPLEPVSDFQAGGEGSRVGLVVLLLLLVLVAAGAAVYALNLFDVRARLGLGEQAQMTPQELEIEEPVEEPEVRPELPSAKLELGDAPVIEIKAPGSGTLATIAESGTAVKEGDEVAKFKGTEAIDKKITEHRERQNFYQVRMNKALEQKAQAEKAGNAALAKRHQAEAAKHQQKVDQKAGLVEAEEQKLESFRLKAPADGVVETSLKAGATFKAGDVLFTIKGAPFLQGTFTIADNQYAQAAEVEVVAKADDRKRLDCRVVKAEGERVTIECPGEGGLGADEEVILRP